MERASELAKQAIAWLTPDRMLAYLHHMERQKARFLEEGPRPRFMYYCSICTFKTERELIFQRHMATHLEYLCDLCPAFYTTESELWKHTLESHIHSEENDYFAETRKEGKNSSKLQHNRERREGIRQFKEEFARLNGEAQRYRDAKEQAEMAAQGEVDELKAKAKVLEAKVLQGKMDARVKEVEDKMNKLKRLNCHNHFRLRCPFCTKWYRTTKRLERHVRYLHLSVVSCHQCDFKGNSPLDRIWHVQRVHNRADLHQSWNIKRIYEGDPIASQQLKGTLRI